MSKDHGEGNGNKIKISNGSGNGNGNGNWNGNGEELNPVSPAVDFTAGVIAGAAGLVVGQPFDVVKVRYQTPQFAGRYNSIHGAFRSIVRDEGVRGLFKGVMSPMAGIAFVNGIVFTSYSFFMKLQHTPEGEDATLGQILLAGTGSGMIASLVTCPTELVKIRQQSMPTNMNPSALKVTLDILRQGGIRGLYRGFSATWMRELAYGPYFFSYEAMCRFFKWRRQQRGEYLAAKHPHGHGLIDEAEAELSSGLSWAELMTAGGVAGVVAWAITFPFDVIKTRMQATAADGAMSTAKPPGMWRVAADSVRKEGWRVMFAGLWPCVVRAIPANMVIFLTFEAIVGALR